MAIRNHHSRQSQDFVRVNGIAFYPNYLETGLSNSSARYQAKKFLKQNPNLIGNIFYCNFKPKINNKWIIEVIFKPRLKGEQLKWKIGMK